MLKKCSYFFPNNFKFCAFKKDYKPNYHTAKFFTKNLLAIEIKKTQIHTNKPLYLGLSILELSKTVMYEFWYDYVKLVNQEKAKQCLMDTGSFSVYIKTDDIYKAIAEEYESRFDPSKYVLNGQLPKRNNKKVIGVMEDELGGKIMKKIIGLRAKTYRYLTDNNDEDKIAKDTKKCVIKRKLKSEDYKNCLEAM